MAGCLALGLRNLVSQCAWAFAGLSVTNIMCPSMTVVVGTTIKYFLDGHINRARASSMWCSLVLPCILPTPRMMN
nr:unnamed protein product [Digitaria exilis]